MEALKEWILSICLCAVAASVLSALLSKGATTKTVKTVIALVLITAAVSPLIGAFDGDGDFKLSEYEFTVSEPDSGELAKSLTEEASKLFEKDIRTFLSENSIEIGEGDTKTEFSTGDNVINLTAIIIQLDKGINNEKGAVEELIFSRYGITPTIVIKDD